MKSAIILHEPAQLELATNSSPIKVLSLSAELDLVLRAKGIPFESAQGLRGRIDQAYLDAERITEALCDHPALQPLNYRGVPLMEALRCSLHAYFRQFLYYAIILDEYIQQERPEELRIPVRPQSESDLEAMLASREATAIADAAQFVAAARGVRIELVPETSVDHGPGVLFGIKRWLFGVLLGVLNALARVGPRPQLNLLASDYWRNIAPVLRELPEARLVLLDRSEAVNIGLTMVLRHRMQFVHTRQFLSRRGKRAAAAGARDLAAAWPDVHAALAREPFEFGGLGLSPVVLELLSYIMLRVVPRITQEVESAYALYDAVEPTAVWLRATISRQIHFSVLPLVARAKKIPSLEIQHGTDHVGPGGITKYHLAGCFASYGPLVNEELVRAGFPRERLVAIGSPRFDAYADVCRSDSGEDQPSILCVTPPLLPGDRYDTYDLEVYVQATAEAARAAGSPVSLTWRGGAAKEAYFQEVVDAAFVSAPHTIVGMSSLRELFEKLDVVVCHYSTVVYEALMYGKPVVIPALSPIERLMVDFHFGPFARAGALIVAHTPQELAQAIESLRSPSERARVGTAGRAFMEQEFLFDGGGSRRIAAWIRKQVR